MSARTKTAAQLLATPVQFLKGVGPNRAEPLSRVGLLTAGDVVFTFPRDYQDLTDLRTIDDLEEGALVSVAGTVEEVDLRPTGTGRSVLGVLIRNGEDYLRAIWFNQPFLRQKFTLGADVLLSGTAQRRGGRWEMTHPRFRFLHQDSEEARGQILPVYPTTEGLNQGFLRYLAKTALALCADTLDETFPQSFLDAHDLDSIDCAIRQIHFPENRDSLARARRRFVYQELFILQLALALKRQQQRSGGQSAALAADVKIDARIRRLFPFELTEAQNKAISEIAADMARPVPMNRLLQGDVGSGKTVVALYAMLLAIARGHQAVLMAPTEVLARQHAETFEKYLSHGQVRQGILTGGLSASARRDVLAGIASGQIDLIVGTHAVVQSDVTFAKLGLVVIDEQHKFGVRQRATLKGAALNPHYLVMTATPIPRTVTMALFGDLDVSTLRDSPPGRQPVQTYLAAPQERSKWWKFFGEKLRQGRQGYVITPLVEESQKVPGASLEETYEWLANGPLEAFRLGLIHGRMSHAEKADAMNAFRGGELQVLVATTVVEVGVDVPGATLMAILSGERFGLAQLHQLRGRISRGRHAGFCCVFADPQTDESRARLEAFVSTEDGFRLAQLDLELRGPGNLLGTSQHGAPPLRIADLMRDSEVLEEARLQAFALVEADPGLAKPENDRLRRMVIRRYGKVLALGDVG